MNTERDRQKCLRPRYVINSTWNDQIYTKNECQILLISVSHAGGVGKKSNTINIIHIKIFRLNIEYSDDL